MRVYVCDHCGARAPTLSRGALTEGWRSWRKRGTRTLHTCPACSAGAELGQVLGGGCACGCGRPVAGGSKYTEAACRVRAHRATKG